MVFVWPALAVALLGIVAGIAIAVLRGLKTWRDVKHLGSSVGERTEAIARSTAEIEVHLTRAGESSERLTAALESLRRSRAELDVLIAALRESRTTVERTMPFLGSR